MNRLPAILLALAISTLALLAQSGRPAEHWVGAWATALVVAPAQQPAAAGRGQAPAVPPAATPQAAPLPAPAAVAPAGPPPTPPVRSFNNQTLRLVVRPTLGGERLRVVLSNQFGTAPLVVGAAHVAPRGQESAIDAQAGRALKFSGSASTTIPAGAVIFSDPVDMALPTGSDLVVDLYVPGDTAASGSPVTMHTGANQTSYVSSTGNYAGADTFPVATTTPSWFLLARVEVVGAAGDRCDCGDRRLDHRRDPIDAEHEQPLAGPSREASGAGGRAEDGCAERGHRRQPGAARQRRPEPRGAVRSRRAVSNRGHAHRRDGRHQRHRTGTRQPASVSSGSDRRPSPAHPPGARARPEDYRRHADAVRRRRLLDARGRGQARCAERMDSYQQGVRRHHRFRRRNPGSESADEISRSIQFRGQPSSRAMLGIRRWQTRSICLCSA